MSETSDDMLTRPLGVAKPAKRRLLAFRIPGRIVAGSACAGLALMGGALALFGDPQGGEPRAVAEITVREAAPVAAEAGHAAADGEGGSLQRSARQVEQASGVTVTRPAGASAPEEPVIIRVPEPETVRLALAPDPRLTERGRHGPMPRMGAAGLRPLDVYARPDTEGAGSARIALVVSGVGVGEAATAAAIARLPPAISLALAPYGAGVEKVAARARQAGHEILVQVPMEPFDYPDSDPGPQTLLTGSRPPENLDRLAWAISRFPGIVGVVNFMGGKLTSDAAALEPVLREIGGRGLGFVDDGSSPRSQVAALAPGLKTPAVRAEIVVDAVPRPEAIDRELARLEAQARQKGFAVASAGAAQMTIDRLARWAQGLEARGIRLVPVSAALRAPAGATRLSSVAR